MCVCNSGRLVINGLHGHWGIYGSPKIPQTWIVLINKKSLGSAVHHLSLTPACEHQLQIFWTVLNWASLSKVYMNSSSNWKKSIEPCIVMFLLATKTKIKNKREKIWHIVPLGWTPLKWARSTLITNKKSSSNKFIIRNLCQHFWQLIQRFVRWLIHGQVQHLSIWLELVIRAPNNSRNPLLTEVNLPTEIRHINTDEIPTIITDYPEFTFVHWVVSLFHPLNFWILGRHFANCLILAGI